MKFVYAGNVRGEGEDTVCYSCGRVIVRRIGYHTDVLALRGSACGYCGAELNFRTFGGESSSRAGVLP